MSIKDDAKNAIKISRKTFFNPSGWIGYGLLKTQIQTTWDFVSNIFTPAEPARIETFEQAMQRLGLTEDSLQKTRTRYLITSAVFLVLALVTVVEGIRLLSQHGTFAGFVLAIPTAALFFVNAFRYHFWAFQIKKRKLGCTFQEWAESIFSSNDRGNTPQ
ncbi:MAG: type IVB secretion system protein IcmV [Gammaproteobacteria bacterium]|nr:type IVB secretion system protein IcmV [Gammaproteobacteria bacterium]